MGDPNSLFGSSAGRSVADFYFEQFQKFSDAESDVSVDKRSHAAHCSDSVVLPISDLFLPVCASPADSKRRWESCHFVDSSSDVSRASLQSNQLCLRDISNFLLYLIWPFFYFFNFACSRIINPPSRLCLAGALPYLRPEIT